jgi:rod shape-determining protein MreD
VTPAAWGRIVLVLLVALVVQVAILDQITLFGAHADLFIVIVVVAGLVGGPGIGAGVGFVAGLFADLVVITPYGLSPLCFSIAGFGIGLLRSIPSGRDTPSVDFAACVAGTAATTLLFAVVGALVGQPDMLGATAAYAVVVTSLGALVLAWPVRRVVVWALGDLRVTTGAAVGSGGSAAG